MVKFWLCSIRRGRTCPSTPREVQAYAEAFSATFADANNPVILADLVLGDKESPVNRKFDKCVPQVARGKTEASPNCILRLRDYVQERRKLEALKFDNSSTLKIPEEFTTDAFLNKIRKYPPDLEGVFAQIKKMNEARPKSEQLLSTYFQSSIRSLESLQFGRIFVVVPGNPSQVVLITVPENEPESLFAKDATKNITAIGVIAVTFDTKKYAKGKRVVTDLKFNDTGFHRGSKPQGLYKPGEPLDCNSCHQGKASANHVGFFSGDFRRW